MASAATARTTAADARRRGTPRRLHRARSGRPRMRALPTPRASHSAPRRPRRLASPATHLSALVCAKAQHPLSRAPKWTAPGPPHTPKRMLRSGVWVETSCGGPRRTSRRPHRSGDPAGIRPQLRRAPKRNIRFRAHRSGRHPTSLAHQSGGCALVCVGGDGARAHAPPASASSFGVHQSATSAFAHTEVSGTGPAPRTKADVAFWWVGLRTAGAAGRLGWAGDGAAGRGRLVAPGWPAWAAVFSGGGR